MVRNRISVEAFDDAVEGDEAAKVQAAIDMISDGEDVEGVEFFLDLTPDEMCKVVSRLFDEGMMSIGDIVNLIRTSAYSSLLLSYLHREIGQGSLSSLKTIVKAVVESLNRGEEWPVVTLTSITQEYWVRIIDYFLMRGDIRRAWDEIRKSFRGLIPHNQEAFNVWQATDGGYEERQGDLSLPIDQVVEIINVLFRKMVSDGLVKEVVNLDPLTEVQIKGGNLGVQYWQEHSLPGVMFIRAIHRKVGNRDPLVTPRMVAISRHFSSLRNAKRKAKRLAKREV